MDCVVECHCFQLSGVTVGFPCAQLCIVTVFSCTVSQYSDVLHSSDGRLSYTCAVAKTALPKKASRPH